MTESDLPESNAPRAIGPIVMLLPLAVLVLGVSFLRDSDKDVSGPRADPPSAESPESVQGWSGRADLEDGSRILVQMGPLHADPNRQRFDTRALAKQLELDEGEIWRLELRYVADGERAAKPFDFLSALNVVDDDGTVAQTIRSPRTDEEFVDPLRVLLMPPVEPMLPGQALTILFWGRAPGEGARLVHGRPAQSEPVETARLFDSLALTPRTIRMAPMEGALARLERR